MEEVLDSVYEELVLMGDELVLVEAELVVVVVEVVLVILVELHEVVEERVEVGVATEEVDKVVFLLDDKLFELLIEVCWDAVVKVLTDVVAEASSLALMENVDEVVRDVVEWRLLECDEVDVVFALLEVVEVEADF